MTRGGGPAVLHLVDQLTTGGAGRSLIASAGFGVRAGGRHRIASLRPPHPDALHLAKQAGLEAAERPWLDEVADADIVHVHFWNTPLLHARLREAWPACRLVLTSHVRGSTSPHILTPELLERADQVICTSPDSLAIAGGKAALAPAAADLGRVAQVRREAHPVFTIGYLGAVDFAKMHPDFAGMHTRLGRPEVRILVAGDGGARRILASAPVPAGVRMELRGQVADVGSFLSQCDVFGYPLRRPCYATTELVVHEAMAAGLPCVVLADGGPAHSVVHGVTGFVAADEDDYLCRLRTLHDDPVLRRRMGEAAALHAQTHFGVDNLAPLVEAVYQEALQQPKRPRPPLPELAGADAFIASLGAEATPFTHNDETAIAQCDPAVASAGAGGVLHWRSLYPQDGRLRLWSGLIFQAQGRPALAAAEFKAAARAGAISAQAHLERILGAQAHQYAPSSTSTASEGTEASGTSVQAGVK